MSLREELIQIAAVCATWAYAIDPGEHAMVGLEIRDEVMRQQELWGDQSHHLDETWLAILAEEVGEAAACTPVPEDMASLMLRCRLVEAEAIARRVLS